MEEERILEGREQGVVKGVSVQILEEMGEKYRGSVFLKEVCICGGVGTVDSHYKVPDARDPRDSQGPTGRTLA